MRNYVEIFFAKYHVHLPGPNFDADGEIWRGSADELEAEIENQRSIWETAGWTFTIILRMPSYWEVSKDYFVRFVISTAQSVTLAGLANDSDPILVFKSPRKRERRRFRLVPIQKPKKARGA